jgi:hypothetical protein
MGPFLTGATHHHESRHEEVLRLGPLLTHRYHAMHRAEFTRATPELRQSALCAAHGRDPVGQPSH